MKLTPLFLTMLGLTSGYLLPASQTVPSPENEIQSEIQKVINVIIPGALNETTNDIESLYKNAANKIQDEFAVSTDKIKSFYELSTSFEIFSDNIIADFSRVSRERVVAMLKIIHQAFNQLSAPKATTPIESSFSAQIRKDMNDYIIELSQELTNLKHTILEKSGLRQKAIEELEKLLGPVQIEKEQPKEGWQAFVNKMHIIGEEFNSSFLNKVVEKSTASFTKEISKSMGDVKDKLAGAGKQIVKEYLDNNKNNNKKKGTTKGK